MSFAPACTANHTAIGNYFTSERYSVLCSLWSKWRLNMKGEKFLAYCFITALFTWCCYPFPSVTTTVHYCLWRAQSTVPSPLLQGKGTSEIQLQCLGNGPITPAGRPIAPHASPYHRHSCLQEKNPPCLIICCTTSSQKMGKWNSLRVLGLLTQISFPLPLLPSVAINGHGIFTDISSRQAVYTAKLFIKILRAIFASYINLVAENWLKDGLLATVYFNFTW